MRLEKANQTGLKLNFKADCPKTWKFGFIVCFLHRAKDICRTCKL